MKLLLLIILSFALVSCSGNKKSQDVSENPAGVELGDEGSLDDDLGGEGDPLIAEGDENPLAEGSEEPLAAADEGGFNEAPMDSAAPMDDMGGGSAPMISDGGGSTENYYTVQSNETLMLIAFKLFGDYEKWRDLLNWNSATLNGSTTITAGMQLKYMRSGPEFVWNPEGNPYLIKRGDTLGTISDSVYQTNRHWRDIWQNNRPLIKNPDVIFAGFTIYTPIIDGRGVANNF